MRKFLYLPLGIFVFCFVLSGCLPTAHTRRAQQLDGYVGGEVVALMGDMGTPAASRRRADNGWVYVWRGCRLEYDWNGRQWPRYCEIRAWASADGIVERWDWWGNECPLEG
ncbi:MAG: hypothetical protein LIP28_07825, partial [Deltaproteobacteria bacterium]|nr:hypothetical protein [Deltaproteobacteria bacterium]